MSQGIHGEPKHTIGRDGGPLRTIGLRTWMSLGRLVVSSPSQTSKSTTPVGSECLHVMPQFLRPLDSLKNFAFVVSLSRASSGRIRAPLFGPRAVIERRADQGFTCLYSLGTAGHAVYLAAVHDGMFSACRISAIEPQRLSQL